MDAPEGGRARAGREDTDKTRWTETSDAQVTRSLSLARGPSFRCLGESIGGLWAVAGQAALGRGGRPTESTMAGQEAIQATHTAAGEGDAEGVARMLDEDPRLLVTMLEGDTLLTQAAEEGHVGVVRLLLERGAEVNAPDGNGDTALHYAAEGGHEEVASLLLSSGADISRRGLGGWTVLMEASDSGHVAVVRLLLRSMGGCGLNERNDNGSTALRVACYGGHANVVQALLLAGADHTIAGGNGRTPQYVAQHDGHPECVALLQWWGPELQRAYALHRARTLHDDTATRQQSPAAAVPAYLSPRVQGGSVLPSVEVGAMQQDWSGEVSGNRVQAREEGVTSFYGRVEMEAGELCAVVGYVVKDLAAELYIELLAGLQQ